MRDIVEAIRTRDVERARALIDAGCDLNINNENGDTLLSYACWRSTAIALLLIEAGVEINAQDNHGATPLWVAARCHNHPTLSALLERGVDVNQPDRFGINPIHAAVFRRSSYLETILRTLLRYGANPDQPCTWGYTARSKSKLLQRQIVDWDSLS